MTRDEHLAKCKEDALGYLDRGEINNAFSSMVCNLDKHPELKNHAGIKVGIYFCLCPGWLSNQEEVRRWIVGFN